MEASIPRTNGEICLGAWRILRRMDLVATDGPSKGGWPFSPDSAVENQGKETWDGTRSGMGVMILSGWLGVWSVRDHSNCAAIGSPSDTVRKRRKNSGRSG